MRDLSVSATWVNANHAAPNNHLPKHGSTLRSARLVPSEIREPRRT